MLPVQADDEWDTKMVLDFSGSNIVSKMHVAGPKRRVRVSDGNHGIEQIHRLENECGLNIGVCQAGVMVSTWSIYRMSSPVPC